MCSQAEGPEPLSYRTACKFRFSDNSSRLFRCRLPQMFFLFPRLGLADESPNPSPLIIGVFVLREIKSPIMILFIIILYSP